MTCLDDALVLGLVEGRLSAADIARVDEHIDQCVSCRDVVTLVAGSRGQARVLERGDNVGRYVIGDLLGAGAMGRVYSAWEPELDRRVAIKVLREEGRDQLVREAQAMAKLSHPNVVTVHEVGTAPAGVFVAMELVDGATLRAWAQRAQPWRDVVRVLVDVARGLDAVHEAGVIHRDVKPENVIVGRDGRVRIGDFGLARATPQPTPTFAFGSGTSIAGTPAYMAPEVLRGDAATPASDQFSFGVLGYELLSGKRPFAGATWAELLASIDRHDVKPLTKVPGWLDSAIRRCLEVDPAKRFSSMRAIADHLAHRTLPRRRPGLWIGGAVLAAAIASGATWLAVRDRGAGPSCAVDELAAVWNPGMRAQLASLPPSALAAIDRWTRAWTDERVADCRAPIAARERCLAQRKSELAALLARAGQAPDRALDAFTQLPPPSECRTADADPLPLDASRAEAARDVLARLPAVRATVALGDARQALAPATALVAQASASGHAPTLAEALLVRAEANHVTDHLDDAALDARDAVAAAERGHADLLRARAWVTRVAIAGDRRDLAVADDLAAVAQAAIDRIGSAHLAATLARLRGLIAYNRGALADARTLLADARTRFAAIAGEGALDVASTDSALGSVARALGELDEADRRHRAALAVHRELRHRDVARDLHNLAGVARLRGDLDQALALYREALAAESATHGEHSIAAGLTHNSIGLVLLANGDLAAAKAEFDFARQIFEANGHGDRAFTEHNLGLVAQAQGNDRGALARFEKAEKLYAETIGAAAPAAIRLDLDRARSELALKQIDAARERATRARERARAAGIDWIADDATAFIAELPRSAPPPGASPSPASPLATRPATSRPATLPPTTSPPPPAPPTTSPPATSPPTTSPPPPAPPTTSPPTTSPPPPARPAPPQKPKRDVGVYGPSQSW